MLTQIECVLQSTSEELESLYPALEAKLSGVGVTGSIPPLSAIDSREAAVRVWLNNPGPDALRDWPQEWDVPRTPPPLLSVSIADTWERFRGALLPELGAIVPLRNIRTLYFDPDRRKPEVSYWIDAFKTLPKLQRLGVTKQGYPSLAIALIPRVAQRGADGDKGAGGGEVDVPLPTLEELILRGLWIRPRPDADLLADIFPALRDTLAARKAAGYQLRRLRLLRCVNVRAEDVDALKSFVQEIDWDKEEHRLDERWSGDDWERGLGPDA